MTGIRAPGLCVCAFAVLVASPPAAMAGPPDSLTGPGIPIELARHRAATLSEIRYELEFRIPADPAAPIDGTLDLQVVRRVDAPLILDFADPARVHRVSADGRTIPHRAVHNHLIIDDDALGPGATRVRIAFTAGDGPLNRSDEFLYTLFVPARAHEAFPSFDQPDLKARYRLRLVVPSDWVAVANGPVLERVESGDVAVYSFGETEPIPTYLFSFAAGLFEIEAAERDGRALRLFHRETDAERIQRNRDAIFDLHATALAWLEEYTGLEYPFGKFDFVAVPSFQYNGMEHPGAILYRASSLFLDESATRNQELGRASVIAHETAHMWFGDLVTMTWFDDVWMKEVFANLMAAKIVHPSFPDLDHDLRFFLAHHPTAYGVDRTPGANPVRQALDNLDDAASLYGAIIYQKAPIVLRQLERLTGEGAFRDAVRQYLDHHAFGNAGWPDLVAILDRVSPTDVAAWSRAWIEEPGRPTIHVLRDAAGLRLRQEDPRGRGLRWEQRLEVRTPAGDGPLERIVRLDAEEARVELMPTALGSGPVLPNADGYGYGLFVLDPATRDLLLDGLVDLEDPMARAVAWVDLYEMMVEALVPPHRVLELARRLVAAEDDPLVEQAVLAALPALFWRWVSPPLRSQVAGPLEDLLWRRLEALDQASRKAAYFNAWRAIASTPAASERLIDVWDGRVVIEGLPLSEQDRTDLALDIAVRGGPEARRILDEQETRIQNPDRRSRFRFVRAAADPDPDTRAAFFHGLALRQNRQREEWVVAALRYLHHPIRAEDSLRFLRPGLDLLLEVRRTGDIFFPTRWLEATLEGHADPEAARIVREFIDDHPGYPPRLMDKLRQTADPLFRATALRT